MTGQVLGPAPAMTALMATFSTVYSSLSWWTVMVMRPMTSSGLADVPVSMCATRSSVGRMIGSPSVQPFSRNSWWYPSSLSGLSSRGRSAPRSA